MSKRTFGSWFSGGGLVDVGAKAAGFELTFAFEYDPDIADVYSRNLGDHITVGNILLSDSGIYHDDYPRTKNDEKRRRQDITGDWWTRAVERGAKIEDFKFQDPQFPHVTTKHDSPPCPNFSLAKTDRSEGLRELALARKCCEYLMYGRPDYYSLENVYLYRNSESFNIILQTLEALGYGYDWWHINVADYGVPQSRKRLILFARKDGKKPVKPMQTHYNPDGKKKESGFIGSLFWKPWIGWYQAIEDLIPDLPDSEFAPWQLERLPDEIRESLYLSKDKGDYSNGHSFQEEPAKTVTANDIGRRRAFILANGSFEGKIPIASEGDPAGTVTANENQGSLRAFIANTRELHKSDSGSCYTTRQPDEPVYTLSSTSMGNRHKAFVVDGQPNNNGEVMTVRNSHDPYFSVLGSANKKAQRAGLSSGRVVQMTPRALARFQTIPDWYELPDNNGLACTVIGNGVPCLFVEVWLGALCH